jgi:hypothetical protein
VFCLHILHFILGLLGGFSGSIFFVLFCLGFGAGWGGGSGEWDTLFFPLSNNSVLFAVLYFFGKKVLFLIVVCKVCNYSQKHFPKAPQIASPSPPFKKRKEEEKN